jgi:hypothetical protein
MGGFAYLCSECLEVPAAQCAYRTCPQRGVSTATVARLSPAAADATRAVAPGSAPPAVATPKRDALATQFVASLGAGSGQDGAAPSGSAGEGN